MQGRTCFVVAQRISTVLNADKIIVLDKGKVAAEGNHAELIASSPIYQEIYESQLGGGFQLEAVDGIMAEEVQS
jgi:ATP-binding cassette subfamily B protein